MDYIEDKEFITEMKNNIALEIKELYKKTKGRLDLDKIEQSTKKIARRIIREEINKSPNIIVNVRSISLGR